MNIHEATEAYEAWLSRQTRLVRKDLRQKHSEMAGRAFPFLRATFYRWGQLWPDTCPELARTPSVLAIGDLHLENFGTWRDSEGRLIWGVNDFDEACPMAYTNDLVRLAASARLAIMEKHLSCDPEEACDAVLEGYANGVHSGGRPFVLAEHNRWLGTLARSKLRDPVRYWKKLDKIEKLPTPLPLPARQALFEDLPATGLECRIGHRLAGLGSLGRQRFTLLCDWCGGKISRETKPLVASAWLWARGELRSSKLWYADITNQAVRVPDPFLKLRGNWVVRRLAPDCSRIELADLPKEREELRLLSAMGQETANVHLGSSKTIPLVRRDLSGRKKGWLRKASARMADATLRDWKEWRRG